MCSKLHLDDFKTVEEVLVASFRQGFGSLHDTTRYALFLSEKYRFKIAFDTQKVLVNQHITHH